MIHSDDLPKAAMFEHAILPDADGSYTTRLFAVEGKPGIWKRVSKADGIHAAQARFNGATIYLVRCEGIEAELKEAGFQLPPLDESAVAGDQEVPSHIDPFKSHHTKRLQGLSV